MATAPDMRRLSINQVTVRDWSLTDAAEGLARHGIGGIGVWLDKVEELGLERSATMLRAHDLRVSSVCRAGFFTTQSAPGQVSDENRRAIEITRGVEADCLYVVCGGMAEDNDLAGARARALEGLAAMAAEAEGAGIGLALEPLHPMMTADRCVVVSLAQALDMVEAVGSPAVGVAVDSYNVWWDPQLAASLERAGDRVISYQICDWLVPQPHPVFGRGIPGDGVIDLAGLTRQVDALGYRGPIEVEIFNEAVWSSDPDHVIGQIADRFPSVIAF
ncbi:sugar phosphate isomerase/epimerase family protein [Pseudactinotalea sp.]|uniref:sugar phosphate isomerase/epimerase family protein n=1 Tax=Pseudactinotalea sp. TaxID=1926260 RepID=UPI003B3B8887